MKVIKLICLVLLFCLQGWGASSVPFRIIMVHSYHQGFEWTDEVDKGFEETLSKSYKIQIVARYYLNAKREPQKIIRAAEGILENLKKDSFDMILITDDDAMKHIGVHFLNSSKYLVFAGINRSLDEYGIQGKGISDLNRILPKNTAGVLEFYPILPLFGLIRKIHPKANKLNLFFDESETSKAVLARFESEFRELEAQKFGFSIGFKVVSNNRNKWEKALLKTNPATEVNLIFPFSNVRDPKHPRSIPTSSEFAEWLISKSKTLEFATTSQTLKVSFFASVGIKGKEHGQDAAEQARALLSGPGHNKVAIGKYARLNINPDRAKALQVPVPFEILAYSHSLQQNEKKNE